MSEMFDEAVELFEGEPLGELIISATESNRKLERLFKSVVTAALEQIDELLYDREGVGLDECDSDTYEALLLRAAMYGATAVAMESKDVQDELTDSEVAEIEDHVETVETLVSGSGRGSSRGSSRGSARSGGRSRSLGRSNRQPRGGAMSGSRTQRNMPRGKKKSHLRDTATPKGNSRPRRGVRRTNADEEKESQATEAPVRTVKIDVKDADLAVNGGDGMTFTTYDPQRFDVTFDGDKLEFTEMESYKDHELLNVKPDGSTGKVVPIRGFNNIEKKDIQEGHTIPSVEDIFKDRIVINNWNVGDLRDGNIEKIVTSIDEDITVFRITGRKMYELTDLAMNPLVTDMVSYGDSLSEKAPATMSYLRAVVAAVCTSSSTNVRDRNVMRAFDERLSNLCSKALTLTLGEGNNIDSTINSWDAFYGYITRDMEGDIRPTWTKSLAWVVGSSWMTVNKGGEDTPNTVTFEDHGHLVAINDDLGKVVDTTSYRYCLVSPDLSPDFYEAVVKLVDLRNQDIAKNPQYENHRLLYIMDVYGNNFEVNTASTPGGNIYIRRIR